MQKVLPQRQDLTNLIRERHRRSAMMADLNPDASRLRKPRWDVRKAGNRQPSQANEPRAGTEGWPIEAVTFAGLHAARNTAARE